MAELLLYMADRAQHLEELIRPCLSEGKTVLCDRYYDATVAYQGFARGLDIGLLNELHGLIFKDLKPDLTLLLDLSPEIGLQRALREIENGARNGSRFVLKKKKSLFMKKSGRVTSNSPDLNPPGFELSMPPRQRIRFEKKS